jgi:hypothetical protein
MSRKECKSNRHKVIGSVETLDDRVLLSAAVPTPATPAPAASPMNVAMVEKFDRKVERIDRDFVAQSKKLKAAVVRKTDRLEAKLASLAKRPQVQSQLVTNVSGSTTPVSPVTRIQVVSNQLDQTVASFSSALTMLNANFDQQLGIVANPAAENTSIPASALENHLQSFRAGLTASATGSRPTIVLGSTSTASTTASSSSTTATTAATTATTTTAATTTGVTATQDFTDATTQAFAPSNSVQNSVDTALQGIFNASQAQFQTSLSNAISGISTTPVGAFQPTVSFVSGNGVTFTSVSTGGTAGTTPTTVATGSGAGTTGTFTTTITG